MTRVAFLLIILSIGNVLGAQINGAVQPQQQLTPAGMLTVPPAQISSLVPNTAPGQTLLTQVQPTQMPTQVPLQQPSLTPTTQTQALPLAQNLVAQSQTNQLTLPPNTQSATQNPLAQVQITQPNLQAPPVPAAATEANHKQHHHKRHKRRRSGFKGFAKKLMKTVDTVAQQTAQVASVVPLPQAQALAATINTAETLKNGIEHHQSLGDLAGSVANTAVQNQMNQMTGGLNTQMAGVNQMAGNAQMLGAVTGGQTTLPLGGQNAQLLGAALNSSPAGGQVLNSSNGQFTANAANSMQPVPNLIK